MTVDLGLCEERNWELELKVSMAIVLNITITKPREVLLGWMIEL